MHVGIASNFIVSNPANLALILMPDAAYAQLSDSTNQIPKNTEITLVRLDTEDAIAGIGHDTKKPTDVIVKEDGAYLIIAAGQIGKTGGGSTTNYVDLWLNVNGEDVPNTAVRASSSIMSIFPGDTIVLVAQAVVPMKKGDVLNVCMAVETADDELGLMVTNPPNRPRVPSIIFTMYKI